ncbi:hypothetical protein HNQ65_000173 [Prosthecobacter vanneervenii]|uniref:Uncharacterized protein n=1 Tax=Prosthecobacter vanneervenii TaxID=48466 RepID=A0A7W8DHZ3_9BACT|nr:hypothetical protein [Prosthecobacter vanneervenii]
MNYLGVSSTTDHGGWGTSRPTCAGHASAQREKVGRAVPSPPCGQDARTTGMMCLRSPVYGACGGGGPTWVFAAWQTTALGGPSALPVLGMRIPPRRNWRRWRSFSDSPRHCVHTPAEKLEKLEKFLHRQSVYAYTPPLNLLKLRKFLRWQTGFGGRPVTPPCGSRGRRRSWR